MDQSLQGWFTERSPMWPGQSFSLQVKKTLFHKESPYQDIRIFESAKSGRVLVLDGIIQLTERDESAYQEMITFLPLNSHPNPKKVLIIGGGDGGVAREVSKHPLVEKIVQCEIDIAVIEACREYIPSTGCGFDSSKLTLVTGDGAAFLANCNEYFDVIITDASDPQVSENSEGEGTRNGPAVTLFDEEYFVKLKSRLNKDGILCCQGENMWLHSQLIGRLVKGCRQIFPVVEYAYTCVPSYPSGQIGFILCSRNKATDFRHPVTVWEEKESDSFSLSYYNHDIHAASFVLPTFMRRVMDDAR